MVLIILIFCIIYNFSEHVCLLLSKFVEIFNCVSEESHPKFVLIQMVIITQLLFRRILPLLKIRCSSRYVYSKNVVKLDTLKCIENILNFHGGLSIKPLWIQMQSRLTDVSQILFWHMFILCDIIIT